MLLAQIAEVSAPVSILAARLMFSTVMNSVMPIMGSVEFSMPLFYHFLEKSQDGTLV